MAKKTTGLLVVSDMLYFEESLNAVKNQCNCLYVFLNIPPAQIDPLPSWSCLVVRMYRECASLLGQDFDMRIILGTLKGKEIMDSVECVDYIFSDSYLPRLVEHLRMELFVLTKPQYFRKKAVNNLHMFKDRTLDPTMYENVVVGGTFDRLHVGHKIFLSHAVMRCSHRLVVGVTEKAMNRSKKLWELIMPVQWRVMGVESFLRDIDSSLEYEVMAISDSYGPTRSDPKLDMIVVSEETLTGAERVNRMRCRNSLPQLEIFCIETVKNPFVSHPQSMKISSSNARMDLLGGRIRPLLPRRKLRPLPHVIGLTGPMGAGKTNLTQILRQWGAAIIDCDKIGPSCYEPCQPCYFKLLKHFGEKVLDRSEHIDRKVLADIVFHDPDKLKTLCKYVWPAMIIEIRRQIHALRRKNVRVVVLDSAVLLQAGWHKYCHEVWAMVVPEKLSVQRIMARTGVSESEALLRLQCQLPTDQMVARANVVFSDQWSELFTKQQAERAWKAVMDDVMVKGEKLKSTNC